MSALNPQLLMMALGMVPPGDVGINKIREMAERAAIFHHATKEELDALVEELIRRRVVTTPQPLNAICDRTGHTPWAPDSQRKQIYWNRYKQWLAMRCILPDSAIDALDESTSQILAQMESPDREGEWDRRGLAVGYVQSGKTANYTGLICKAADAGYKVIIVLAGLHNNLRAQTQLRIEEGFLGVSTAEDGKLVGVGTLDSDSSVIPYACTRRDEKGDVSSSLLKNLTIRSDDRPWVFVVKKNKSVLSTLAKWLKTNEKQDSPMLMIDDEADHGSVDTKAQYYDVDQTPDPEHAPSTINRLIRKILVLFKRKCYIGYTATPFANIFINQNGETEEDGDDIFPRSFIVPIPASSNYVGAVRIFGQREDENSESRIGGLPELIHVITDNWDSKKKTGWLAPNHKQTTSIKGFPDSLKQAIDSFILATAVRKLRGMGDKHTSMLIHVSRFTKVQEKIQKLVAEHVKRITGSVMMHIGDADWLDRAKALYETDFIHTSRKVMKEADLYRLPHEPEPWESVQAVLPDVLDEITVKSINGQASDVLDYDQANREGRAIKAILIGGDKMSRGLTFEGLTVSYFLRYASTYDSLMQMGRWFGYRDKYLDIIRLYAPKDILDWYKHITDASEELMEEFAVLASQSGEGITPEEFGLKVLDHDTMTITARNKMRNVGKYKLSYGGTIAETVVFDVRDSAMKKNYNALTSFMRGVSEYRCKGDRVTNPGQKTVGIEWSGVPAVTILKFLADYQTHESAYRVRCSMLSEYIRKMFDKGELTTWTVALVSPQKGERNEPHALDGTGDTINLVTRNEMEKVSAGGDTYSIGRLLNPMDEAIGMSQDGYECAFEQTRAHWQKDEARGHIKEPIRPSGPWLRAIRGKGFKGWAKRDVAAEPQRGLMILYLVKSGRELPYVGMGISFPDSVKAIRVDYVGNNVYKEIHDDSIF